MHKKQLYSAGLLLAATFLVGCGSETAVIDPAVLAEHRERLMLTEEPAGAVTPLDLREPEGEDAFTSGPVVLVGQIGGMPNPWADTEQAFPWVAGEATFFLVDPATAAEFADHATDDPEHAANCAFCARRAEKSLDAVAAVTFNDQDSKPIAIQADELLNLNAEDVVVVRGQGRLLAGNLLVVEAEGVYVRR